MFKGLSAFPLTPVNEERVDAAAYGRLINRLVSAGVNSIGALGSTGSYAYLTRDERAKVTKLAVENSQGIPVIVGIGSPRTKDVLACADDAQKAGASGVLLAPVSYQKLTSDEVYGLFERVAHNVSIPLVVYDNPGTTNFVFSDELYQAIAALPHVASIKIPGVPITYGVANARVATLRAKLPKHISIGVSGDSMAAIGLNAGCDAWYSVIGGLFPKTALALVHAANAGCADEALRLSNALAPLWSLFDRAGGSLRVVAAAAELLNLVENPCLPQPVRALHGELRQELRVVLNQLKLEQ
jgi:4-hydroxy-tetrahydrodipicolinate synthase